MLQLPLNKDYGHQIARAGSLRDTKFRLIWRLMKTSLIKIIPFQQMPQLPNLDIRKVRDTSQG